jgi:thiol-disulfide isomerase/thioredoxin
MPLLIAAVVLVGILCVLDLILTLGVIKRLREHTEMISSMMNGPKTSIAVGEEVGEFTTSTVDGERVARESLGDDALVAFFSPTCQPCKEKLPHFVEFARNLPRGRDQVLATVIGDAELADELVTALQPVARVVVESGDGTVATAFKVKAYPTVLRVAPDGDRRVLVTSDRVELGQPALVK